MKSSIQISSLETFKQHEQYQKIKSEEEEKDEYLVENHVDDIGLDLKDNPKRFIFEVRRLFKKLHDYCPHWDMTCWNGRNET